MPSFSNSLHLFLDGIMRNAVGLKHTLGAKNRDSSGLGASLPGGQVHLAAAPITEDDGFTYLRTGNSKHSMWRTVEWQLLLKVVDDLPRPILDLGCGDGAFGALFTDRIEYGIDGDADAVGQCNPAVYQESFPGDLRETLAVPDGSLGSAFSNSTLEHVKPLEPAIASVSRALRSGGKLIITVPTDGLTDAVTEAYGADLAERLNQTLGHHNLWPWARWEELLRANGFAEVNLRGYLSRPAMQWYASRFLAPWPQLSRRAPDWLWQHDMPAIKRHVEESLEVLPEKDATCLLIEAIKS